MSWTSITTTLQCWKGMCWKNWCHDDLIGKNLATLACTHPVPAGVSEEASQTNYSRSNHYFWRWSTNSQGWVNGGLSVTFEWEVRPLKPVLHYYVIKLQSLNHFQCHSLIQYSQKNTLTLSHSAPLFKPVHYYGYHTLNHANVCVCLSPLTCVTVSMSVSMSEVVFGNRACVW